MLYSANLAEGVVFRVALRSSRPLGHSRHSAACEVAKGQEIVAKT